MLNEQLQKQIEREGDGRAEGFETKLLASVAKIEYEIGAETYAELWQASEVSAKERGEIITQLNNRLTNLETALREIQAKAKRGIFPHLPVETMGAQMCIEIDGYITDLFTPKTTPR
jgi:hypothetical protein